MVLHYLDLNLTLYIKFPGPALFGCMKVRKAPILPSCNRIKRGPGNEAIYQISRFGKINISTKTERVYKVHCTVRIQN